MKNLNQNESNFSMKDDPVRIAWENVVLKDSPPGVPVREAVLNSWIKSKKMGLDPFSNEPPPTLSGAKLKQLFEDNKALIETAKPVMKMIEILIRDTGFLITLSEKSGYVLVVRGESNIFEMAKRNYYIPGCRRDIEHAGTNGIGLCLEVGRPIQLTGCEHYRAKHHDWTCSSAPIFDESDNPIGAITLSGHCTGQHQHTLALVTAAAENIETQLKKRSLNIKFEQLNCLLSSIVNSMDGGVVALDTDLRITHINKRALNMLGVSHEAVFGKKIEETLHPDDTLMVALNTNSYVKSLEAEFTRSKRDESHMCSIAPILNDTHEEKGKLITLAEKKDVINIVKRFGGNYAKYDFEDIKGENEKLKNQIALAKIAAKSESRILIYGKSGTGKELFAQSIHRHSNRNQGPFVAISCSAIPRDLVESELFGYRAGAFTGARREGMTGKFELANNGTLFFDEINALPLDVQTKLLRVLQQNEIMRLGDNRTVPIDVRVIAATNTDLFEEVENKNFRADLYYRLNVVEITIPPLRERLDDLELLIDHFIKRQCVEMGVEKPQFTEEAMEILKSYHWPGNIRELENCIERAVLLSQGKEISISHLPQRLMIEPDRFCTDALSLSDGLQEMIKIALERCDGNVSRAARELNIARSTLYRKMDEFGISNPS